MKNNICAVIVAAGSGKRMGAKENKVFLNLFDKPILAYTLEIFQQCKSIDSIVLVTRECDIGLCQNIISRYNITKTENIVVGGTTRQQSVYNGLNKVCKNTDIVVIHDGARALIEKNQIEETIKYAKEYGASAVGVKCKDTLKQIDQNGFIANTINREVTYNIQTPQTFKYDIILSAHKKAIEDDFETTDDCAVAEHCGVRIKLAEGSYDNIKLTTPEDLTVAENILRRRERLQ